LIGRSGKIITRHELKREVWDKKDTATDRNLDPHISSLRKKLEHTDFLVKTAYGNGYCLDRRDLDDQLV
jgi:DNA-binding response OmpR family regulator